MLSSLSKVGLPQPRPVILCTDNTSAIYLANNEKHNAMVKHINVCKYYIHKCIAASNVVIKYIPSARNLADIFTKIYEMMRLTGLGSGSMSQGRVNGGS